VSRIHVCVGYKCVLGTSVCLGKVCVRDMKSWVQLRGEETKADGTNFFEILDFFPF
jgi:hypothetical protein